MTDERGYTIVELLVGAMVSLIVLGAIMAMVQVATRSQDRVSERVYANQRGRPAMAHIVNRLHASCVAPGLAPVRAGSTGSSLVLYSKTGSAVNPTPDKYLIDLTGGTLSETRYPGSGSEPAKWTFGTPSSPQQLLDGVGTALVGSPPAAVPFFRYFAYEGGQVAATPLATPLSEADAARTVQVNIAFTIGPYAGADEPYTPITLSDSATLRIEPASEDSAEVNLPCV